MGDKYDWKKIIQMVAIIGVLCIFVGIATRIMQKSQTSLSDYAKKNPETALAVPEKESEDETEKVSDIDQEKDVVDEKDPKKNSSTDSVNESENDKSDKESENKDTEQQFIYENFYYTEESEGYKFRIAYYDSKHRVSTVELSANVEDPDETLSFFYDMYKAEHEFADIKDVQKMMDRFAVPESEDNG